MVPIQQQLQPNLSSAHTRQQSLYNLTGILTKPTMTCNTTTKNASTITNANPETVMFVLLAKI